MALICVKNQKYFKPNVADSSLAFTISIEVPIQREPKDYHCLAVLETQFLSKKYIVVLENVTKIDRISNKITQSQ